MEKDLKIYFDKYNSDANVRELYKYSREVDVVLREAYRYVFLNYLHISPEEEFDPRERDYYYTSEIIDIVAEKDGYIAYLLERMMVAHLSCCTALDFAYEDNKSPEEIEREYDHVPFVNLDALYEYVTEKYGKIFIPVGDE